MERKHSSHTPSLKLAFVGVALEDQMLISSLELVCFCYNSLRGNFSGFSRHPILGRRQKHQRCCLDLHNHLRGCLPEYLRHSDLW